jgi:hypothetical protein
MTCDYWNELKLADLQVNLGEGPGPYTNLWISFLILKITFIPVLQTQSWHYYWHYSSHC